MSDTLILPAPTLPIPHLENKWEREHRAFCLMLPQLMKLYHGKYVAVHEEKVVDSDDDKQKLAMRVLAKIGNVAIHVGLVSSERAPISRSGLRREA